MPRPESRRMKRMLVVAGLCAALGACGTGTENDGDAGPELFFNLPPGSDIVSASWVLTGGGLLAPRMGDIDVAAGSDTISTRLGNIPIGSDYHLVLTARTGEGLACVAEEDFDMPSAGATVSLDVTLNCESAEDNGDVDVDGQLNYCPTIDVVVSPREVPIGSDATIGALVGDVDGDTIISLAQATNASRFLWATSEGRVPTPAFFQATITCSEAGPVTITVFASDDDCEAMHEVSLICLPEGEGDGDEDGVADALDNCPSDANPTQRDSDGDTIGDACDDDIDGDGVDNAVDNCEQDANDAQADADDDDIGDVCDDDLDGDGVDNETDNCPFSSNPGQSDTNADGIGNACANDRDSDGVTDAADNCLDTPNPDQVDFDADGAGDACDLNYYTEGHGDLVFEFNVFDIALDAFARIDTGTVDGIANVNRSFPLELFRVVTDAPFTRPAGDNGAFSPLCVDAGESVVWLPQGNGDSSDNEVPFLGIENDLPAGVFVDDSISLQLLGVASPNGIGDYAMWKDGLPPGFFMSSCDGVDARDELLLRRGHDHFNMAFANDGPGIWDIHYRVSAERIVDGATISEDFTVHYDLR